MIIETKFDLGQEVYGVRTWRDAKRIKCPVCGGTHRIQHNGHDFLCTVCDFDGTVFDKTITTGHVVSPLTVGVVRPCRFVRVDKYTDHLRDEYMCEETGLGSGTCWNDSNLFATREEADAALRSLLEGTP